MNVGFISLGCSKNLIDTEVVIGIFKKNKITVVNDETKADILVINTCGFIESAKEEAINTILEMKEYKKKKCKYLIVMGCLVQRYYNELIEAIPEVDLYIRLDEYEKLWEKVDELINKRIKIEKKTIQKTLKIEKLPMLKQEEFLNRTITTGENYAYLKIGEGCSNKCTYCAIPYIRGPFVSRKMEDILEEAQKLANNGIKEIIVIAQDTSKYGIDIYGKQKLAELLEKLSEIENIKWIRVIYTYPEGITDELIDVIAKNKKIAKYFDIPLQHISNDILKKMNRKTSKEKIEKLINKIKNRIPNVTIRTSLIVGFPGETELEFKELLEFVQKTKFDKLGVFMYSKEENTPAARLPNQIHGNTKKSRYNKIMKIQKEISENKMKEKIGKKYDIIIEKITNKYYIGRTIQDNPEIDGITYIRRKDSKSDTVINQIIECKIIDSNSYDLIGIMNNKV